MHSYEELIYAIEGNPVLTIDGESVVLSPDDCAFVPIGSTTTGTPLGVRDPRARRYSRWSHAQHDLEQLKLPSPLDAAAVSASMSSALLAYSGISVKMLIDERHGAHLGNLFMVDYHPGVVLHPHDHPIEGGLLHALGRRSCTSPTARSTRLRLGDVAYAGVGCIHAFEPHGRALPLARDSGPAAATAPRLPLQSRLGVPRRAGSAALSGKA